MADRDLVLGYDFGTSAVKAALFDRDGVVAAQASRPLLLHLPEAGWAEQDAEDWWQAMVAATSGVLAAVPAAESRIAAIGLSAQMCGVVPVDAAGNALHPALIWLDTRSADIAQEIMGGWLAGYGPVKLARWLRLTGGAPSLSGRDAISKMVWLRRHRPALWPRISKLLDVKDYILTRCTGRFMTSFDSAHLTWLFDARPRRKCWSPALLNSVGLDPALLPEIGRASDVAGGLAANAAAALGLAPGTPVTVGAGDVAAAAIGAGNPEQASLHLYLGTSAWLAARVPRSRVDIFTSVGSLCFADGQDYLLIATQENAGASISWGLKLLGFADDDFTGFEAAARCFAPLAEAAMFFPWLAGERVPVDDEHVRGGFANLSLRSGRDEIAYAIHEGVALNLRWAMKSFDRLSGRAGQRLRLVGGGARNEFWAQLFADVLGREVEVGAAPELCGTRGAAMTAAVAAGWYADIDAAAAMAKPGRVYAPNAALAAHYDIRFRCFASFYSRIRGWYRP